MSQWASPTCDAARGRVAAGSLCEGQEASPSFLTLAFFAIMPPRLVPIAHLSRRRPPVALRQLGLAAIFSSVPHPSFQPPPGTQLGPAPSRGTVCLPTGLQTAHRPRASLWDLSPQCTGLAGLCFSPESALPCLW